MKIKHSIPCVLVYDNPSERENKKHSLYSETSYSIYQQDGI